MKTQLSEKLMSLPDSESRAKVMLMLMQRYNVSWNVISNWRYGRTTMPRFYLDDAISFINHTIAQQSEGGEDDK